MILRPSADVGWYFPGLQMVLFGFQDVRCLSHLSKLSTKVNQPQTSLPHVT
jgi:hypothetical protein